MITYFIKRIFKERSDKMRLRINEKGNRYFCNCMGIHLSDKQKQQAGVADLDYVESLHTLDGFFIGAIFHRNGLLGAYNEKGQNYAEFKYEKITPANLQHSNDKNDKHDLQNKIFNFKHKGKELYDVYYLDTLMFAESICPVQIIIDEYLKEDKYVVFNAGKDSILYDVKEADIVAYLDIKDFDINKIIVNSYFQRIILNYNCRHSSVYDFNGKLLTNSIFFHNGTTYFSDVKDYYIRYDSHKNRKGLFSLQNNELKQIIPVVNMDIFQVFEDKAVILNSNEFVKVVPFEQVIDYTTTEMKWSVKRDKYKFKKDIKKAYFLEDESEAILTLDNEKQILLSHYKLPDNKKYQCDLIIKEEFDDAFKCFQFNGVNDLNVTHIYQGNAVSYTGTSDSDIHVIKTLLDNMIRIYSPNGKLLFRKNYNKCTLSKLDKNPYRDYFLTKEIEGEKNLLIAYDNVQALSYFINGKTEESIPFDEKNNFHCMIWHNFYEDINGYHSLKELTPSQKAILDANVLDIYVMFDEYIVCGNVDTHERYISDKNGHAIIIPNAKIFSDQEQAMCLCLSDNIGYTVTNDGVDEFAFIRKIDGLQTYQSKSNPDHFIINRWFATASQIKDDIKSGLLDKAFEDIFN